MVSAWSKSKPLWLFQERRSSHRSLARLQWSSVLRDGKGGSMTKLALFAWTACLLAATSAVGQIDPELSGYVASRRKAMDDPSRPIAEREHVALEVAATLDRAAWAAESSEARRGAWSEARAILDGFSSRNPGHPRDVPFAFQATVYLWAEGQSWARQAASGDQNAHARATSALDGAIDRLRPIVASLEDSNTPLAQNARFRLARALLDRAAARPGAPGRARSSSGGPENRRNEAVHRGEFVGIRRRAPRRAAGRGGPVRPGSRRARRGGESSESALAERTPDGSRHDRGGP